LENKILEFFHSKEKLLIRKIFSEIESSANAINGDYSLNYSKIDFFSSEIIFLKSCENCKNEEIIITVEKFEKLEQNFWKKCVNGKRYTFENFIGFSVFQIESI